jgi:hypothetical protein
MPPNPPRPTILEEFQVGQSDIETRMKVLRTDVLDHLLAFLAAGNSSFRCAESSGLWDLLKAAMQLGQAFPRVDPDVVLERIGRKAMESRFGEAVAGRLRAGSGMNSSHAVSLR